MPVTLESAPSTTAMSAQEAAIASGNKIVHGTVTDRVLRLYEAIHPSNPPRVALDRAVLFTESFKETGGQPLVLRWAKALKHFAEKAPVVIFDDELIVGRPNTSIATWSCASPATPRTSSICRLRSRPRSSDEPKNTWVDPN